MSLLLLLITIAVSVLVVRMGALALRVTGMEWSVAKFQAISCFSGTGFTTTEAELITGNPQRRKIATILMILGHAGLVTMIAAFANSLQPGLISNALDKTFIHKIIPAVLFPWVNITVVALVIYAIYKITTRTQFLDRITDPLQNLLLKKGIIARVSFQEIMVGSGGYGVFEISLTLKSPLKGKTLKEIGTEEKHISIVAMERKGEIIHRPPSNTRLKQNDKIICFGKLNVIKKTLCPAETGVA